jgi:hypothetical protein
MCDKFIIINVAVAMGGVRSMVIYCTLQPVRHVLDSLTCVRKKMAPIMETYFGIPINMILQ